ISSEWKYQLSDPVANAIGSALYLEVLANTNELEFEGRVILDRRVGKWMFAFNAMGEYELEFASEGVLTETKFEADLGAGYFLNNHLFAGLEVREQTVFTGTSGLETSVLFGGPVLSWASRGYWATLTFLPQLTALYGATQ